MHPDWKSFTKMKTTTILAIVTIVAALAMASFVPIHQASAAPEAPGIANGQGSSNSNPNANNQGTHNAYYFHTGANQPCSVYC